MGLLDDAIKEHLELKRRRGADAEEVARLEQEALGPPQRGEFAGASAPAKAGDAPDDDGVAAVQAEPAPDTTEHAAAEPAPEPEPEPAPAPAPEPEPEPRDHADETWLDDEPGPPVEPVESDDVPLDQPTVEYSPPAEGEDVLEETPDFLQETPEHDRLWFEQKPPRDFDLDR
jgi:hypothetical protein